MSGSIASTPERKVLGELGNSDPLSPTANLRLLTNLASRLNNVPENSSISPKKEVQTSNSQKEPRSLKLLPRKEKSLSLLCNK